MSKSNKEDLLYNKQELEKKLNGVNKSLEEIKHQEELKEYAPITMEEFNEYMLSFAKYVMMSIYEPWEFESEDMGGIVTMALKAGIRVPEKDLSPDLKNTVELADEALELSKEDN